MGQGNTKSTSQAPKKVSQADALVQQFSAKFFAPSNDTLELRLKVAEEFAQEHPRILEDGYYWNTVLQCALYSFHVTDSAVWEKWTDRAKLAVKFNHLLVTSWVLAGKLLCSRYQRVQQIVSVLGLGLCWQKPLQALEGSSENEISQPIILSVATSGPLPVATDSAEFATAPMCLLWAETMRLLSLENSLYLSRLSPDIYEEVLRVYAHQNIWAYRYFCNLEVLLRHLRVKFASIDLRNMVCSFSPPDAPSLIDVTGIDDGHMTVRTPFDEIPRDAPLELRLEKIREATLLPGNPSVRPMEKAFSGIAMGVIGDERTLSARISLRNSDPNQLLKQYQRLAVMVESWRKMGKFEPPPIPSVSLQFEQNINNSFRKNILFLEKLGGLRLRWQTMGAYLPVGNTTMMITKPDYEFGTMRIMCGIAVRNSELMTSETMLNFLERVFDNLTYPSNCGTSFLDGTLPENHESREFFIERTVSLVDVPESFLADQIFELQAIHLSLDVVFDNVFRMGLPRICEELSEAYERPLRESAASSPPIISSIRGTATLEHHDISCSSCNKPIVGIRFLCLNCVEEKNFCAKCLTPLHAHERSHIFGVMVKRAPAALERYFKENRPFPLMYAEDEIAQNKSFEIGESAVAHDVPCSHCRLSIGGTVFRCMRCRDFRLCPQCYALHQHSVCHAFFALNWPSSKYSAVTPSHYEELAVHTSNWELIYTPLSFTERKALLQHKNLSVQLAGCLGLLDAVLFPHPDVPVPSDFSLKNITELLKERKSSKSFDVVSLLQTKALSAEKKTALILAGIFQWALETVAELPSLSSLQMPQIRGINWLLMVSSAFPQLNSFVFENPNFIRNIFNLIMKDPEGVSNWAYSAISGEGGSCTVCTVSRMEVIRNAVPDTVEKLLRAIPQTMYSAFFVVYVLLNLSRHSFIATSLTNNARLIKQLMHAYKAVALVCNYLRLLHMRTLHCGGYYSESLAFAREILHTKETAFPFVFDTCDMLSDVISPYYPNCFRDVLTEAGYISIALRAFESDTTRLSALLCAFGCVVSASVGERYEPEFLPFYKLSQALPAAARYSTLRVLDWWSRKLPKASELKTSIAEDISAPSHWSQLNHHYSAILASEDHYQVLVSMSSELASYYCSDAAWRNRPVMLCFLIQCERVVYREMRITSKCVAEGLLDRCISMLASCAYTSDNVQLAACILNELYLSAELLSSQPEKMRTMIAEECLARVVELVTRSGEERLFTACVTLLEAFALDWRVSSHSLRAAKELARLSSHIKKNLRLGKNFSDDDAFNPRLHATASMLRFDTDSYLFDTLIPLANILSPVTDQLQWHNSDAMFALAAVAETALRYAPLCNHNAFLVLTKKLIANAGPLFNSFGKRLAHIRAVTLISSACVQVVQPPFQIGPSLPKELLCPPQPVAWERFVPAFGINDVYDALAAEERYRAFQQSQKESTN